MLKVIVFFRKKAVVLQLKINQKIGCHIDEILTLKGNLVKIQNCPAAVSSLTETL